MRLLNGFSDGFLHWVGGTTLALRGTRTLKREKKTWNDRGSKYLLVGGKVVIPYLKGVGGEDGAGQIIIKPDPASNPIRVLKENLNSTHP